LDLSMKAPAWKLAAARVLADVAPRFGMSTGLDTANLSTDPAVGQAARSDPLYHSRMTPGAWREIRSAQADVVRERERIVAPVLFLVAGDDRIVSRRAAEDLARGLAAPAEVVVYEGMFHEVYNERERGRVLADLGAWLDRLLAAAPPAPTAMGRA